ncbi:hypothetical protein [Bacteriovorax sp. DB6_IX]|uniref:hypothetical protein n=1 Tax=Bacteriovorax sp. DB6_IX TaxID=1353530 RepID=UPI00038A4876|nr:hypothetical protein [Bacteriovorax sp. DB6_IX]EQC51988.1 hypothetical protein M901_1729 [Bacteriovorax sp. DB6_IX]
MRTLLSIWHRFIVGLICFMMVNISISVDNQIIEMNMGSVAYAAESGSSGNSGVEQGETGSVNIEEEDGGGLGFLTGDTASFIVFMAAAIIIGRMLYRCDPKSVDVYLAAAGALIYIAGELMVMFGSKAEIDEKKLEYKTHGDDGQIDDSQYQALVKEKQVLEEVAKAADKKSKFQMAAATAFYGASAASIGLAALEASALTSCSSAIAAATSVVPTCGTCMAPVSVKELIKKTFVPSLPKYTKSKAADVKLEAAAAACVAAGTAESVPTAGTSVALAGAVASMCTTYVTVHGMTEMACAPVPSVETTGFMAIFTPVVEGLDKVVDLFWENPTHRGIVWFGLGGYGHMVSNATAKEAEKARDNIKEIDKVLRKMDLSRVKTTLATSNISKINLSGALQKNLYKPVELSENMPCATGKGKVNATTGQVDCPPAPKYTTNSNSRKTMTATGYEGLSNLASELVSGIQGKNSISPETQAKIDQLASNNNAIKKKLRNNIKKLNLARKAAGQKPIDVNKMGKQMFSKMRGAVKRSLMNKGLTPDGFLASAKLGIPSDLNRDNKEELAGKEEEIKTEGGDGLAAGAKKKDGFKFDFNVDDEVAKKKAEFAKNEAAAHPVPDASAPVVR